MSPLAAFAVVMLSAIGGGCLPGLWEKIVEALR